MKTLGENSRFSGRDLNPEHLEYEVGVVTNLPRRLVVYNIETKTTGENLNAYLPLALSLLIVIQILCCKCID